MFVLNYKVTQSVTGKSTIADAEEVPFEESKTNINQIIKVEKSEYGKLDNVKKVELHLTNDKTAYLVHPNDLTDDDIAIIDYNLKGIK